MPIRVLSLAFALSLIFALLITGIVSAETQTLHRLDGSAISSREIDATALHLLKAGHVPGMGIALFNNSHVVYLKAYGLRDTEKNLPMTSDSVMTAASLTKAAFATLVLQLAQDGSLDLDRPVWKYLPKPLPEYAAYHDLAADPRYKELTLCILLSHTSGFPNFRAYTGGRLSIHFKPGTRFAYSGEGIRLAQLTVESVTGKPLAQLMRERLFGPLHMTRTSMVWENHFETDYANGYAENGLSLGPEKRTHADAAGSMQTTLRDYTAFLQSLLQNKVLAPKTRALMFTPQIRIHSRHEFPSLSEETTTANDSIRLSYGLGWGLYASPYGQAFFKEGHDDGWRHYAVCFSKSGTGLLIMTNSANGEGIYQEMLRSILGNTSTPIEWEGFRPYTQITFPPPPRTTRSLR